ncbi:MAG: hypothetical protein K0S86_657 [Geminicoccaceae bacterium]|nr:hypothetical protein [Geminicoccaceae bacterium]
MPTPTDPLSRIDRVFDAAVDLPHSEQAAFVDHACGDDHALRAEVIELLRTYHHADSFLEAPVARFAAPFLGTAATTGGRYQGSRAFPEGLPPLTMPWKSRGSAAAARSNENPAVAAIARILGRFR